MAVSLVLRQLGLWATCFMRRTARSCPRSDKTLTSASVCDPLLLDSLFMFNLVTYESGCGLLVSCGCCDRAIHGEAHDSTARSSPGLQTGSLEPRGRGLPPSRLSAGSVPGLSAAGSLAPCGWYTHHSPLCLHPVPSPPPTSCTDTTYWTSMSSSREPELITPAPTLLPNKATRVGTGGWELLDLVRCGR